MMRREVTQESCTREATVFGEGMQRSERTVTLSSDFP